MYAAEKSDTGVIPKKAANKIVLNNNGGVAGGKAGDQGKFLKRRLRTVRSDRRKH
jgi:hypothetical protein